MKRFLVALLSLGIVMALSVSAFAVSANFTGTYFVKQQYYDNPSLLDKEKGSNRAPHHSATQEFRMFTRLKIADGLNFTMRADILEYTYGHYAATSMYSVPTVSAAGAPTYSAGSSALVAITNDTDMKRYNTQNISVEQTFITFDTALGTWNVGMKSGRPFNWGTWFINSTGTVGGVDWTKTFGNVTVVAEYGIKTKGDSSAEGLPRTPLLNGTDFDRNWYDISATYKTKALEAGLQIAYFRSADKRASGTSAYLAKSYVFDPYFKAKFGNLSLEGEGYYIFGKIEYETETATRMNQDIKTRGGYLEAKYQLGAAWIGAHAWYASGADATAGRRTGGGFGPNGSGQEINGNWLQVLGYGVELGQYPSHAPNILFGTQSDPIHLFTPLIGATDTTSVAGVDLGDLDGRYDNTKVIAIKGGYAFSKKWDAEISIHFAKLDKIPATTTWSAAPVTVYSSSSDELGTEIDIRTGYRIFDNLLYQASFSYLKTGDFYKGTATSNPAGEQVKNVYQIQHWLTLFL